MKRPLLLTVITLLFFNPLFSQDADEKLKDVFLDAEYFLLNENYLEALYSYNVLYKRGFADNANINYRIGQCYLNIPGEKSKSIPYLEKASKRINIKYTEGSFKEINAPYDVFFLLGNAYRITYQTDKAIEAYTKYKELVGPKNPSALTLANKEINACNIDVEIMKTPREVERVNMGRPINTSARDISPVVSGDESELVYNSAQKFYDAVFFCKRVNNKWSTPINITPEIQSDGDQYCSSLSFDGTELYLRKEDNFDANIMVAKYENGRWNKSEPLGKNINTKFWEGNACVSKDGKTLYFSSNKTGGYGALDLYKSERKPNENWGPAVNLGNLINTEFNEDAPFITEDGKRLYFISQGHNTMGGYDIFYSDLDTTGQWKQPINLGYPVNTADDDLYFCPVRNGSAAYVSLYEKGGNGYEDLYRIQIGPEKLIAEQSNLKDSIDKQHLVAKQPIVPDGDMIDTLNKVQKPVEVAVVDSASQKRPATVAETVEKILVDSAIQARDRIVLRCVFFDFNKASLTIKAQKELDHLTMVMNNYTEMKIELIGNTDAKGSDEYNLGLSEKRANNAKAYLVKKGILAERITIKGMGKKNFVAINNNPNGTDNPDGRFFNRRVDIRVLEAKNEAIIIEEVKVPEQLKINGH
jgi:outer membrane protein OmpA-like peptidoglycan-associated protein